MTARILLLLFLTAAALALASCADAPLEVPKEVKVPVPVACVPADKRPQAPVLRTEADLMAMDRYRRTIAAWSDKIKLEAYAAELAAIVEACSRIIPDRSVPAGGISPVL